MRLRCHLNNRNVQGLGLGGFGLGGLGSGGLGLSEINGTDVVQSLNERF